MSSSSPDHDSFRTLLAMAGRCSNLDELKHFCSMLLGPQAPPDSIMDLTTTSISTSTSEHSSHSYTQESPLISANTVVPSNAGNAHFQADDPYEPIPVSYLGNSQIYSPYSINQASVLPVYTATEEYTISSLPPYAIVIKSKIPKHFQFGATQKYREFRKRHTPLEVLKYKMICHFKQCSHLFEGTVPTHEDQLLFVAFDGNVFCPVRCDKVLRSDIVKNGQRKDITQAEEIEYLYIQIKIKKRTLQTFCDYDKSVLIVQNVLNSIEAAINCGIPNMQALDKHKTLFKETWKLYFPEHNETIKPKKKLKENNHENDGNGDTFNEENAGNDGRPGDSPDQSNTGGGSSGQSHGFSGGQTYGGGTGYASLQNHLHTCKENDSSHDSDENSTDDSLPGWKHGSSDSDESEDGESDGDDDDDDDNENGMPKIESASATVEVTEDSAMSQQQVKQPDEKLQEQPDKYTVLAAYHAAADAEWPLDEPITARKEPILLETMHLEVSDDIKTTKSFGSKPDDEPQESQQEQNEDDGGGMPKIVSEKTFPNTMSSPIEAMSNTDDLSFDTLETMHSDQSDEIESKKRFGSKPDEEPHQLKQEQNEYDGGGVPMIVFEKTVPNTTSALIEIESIADDITFYTCQESLEIMDQRRRNELGYMDIPFLTSNGFSLGFIEAFHRNRSKVYQAYYIWDNSGSMSKFDGVQIRMSYGNKKIHSFKCTRWKELSETALFQIDLAAAIRAPTTHRILNHPGHNTGKQIFSIASTPEDTTLEHDVSVARATIQQVKPSGHTPLTEHIRAIRAIVEPMNEHLRTNGKKIAIVIATDGLPSTEYGGATKQAHDLFMAEMMALGQYEVFVVVRLCTNESRVVGFWNGLDKNPELKLIVLDDYFSEAKRVHAKNPWLTYGLALHRLREMGFDDEVLDDLDERPYSVPEIQEFLTILLGQVVLPDPDVNWRNFCDQVEEYLSREQMPYNPIFGRTTPWINMRELRRLNPRRRWVRL